MNHLLQTEEVTIGYRLARGQSRVVARDLSVVLEPGQLVCLLGANGAGKSTLLRTLIGAQKPLAGHVSLSGQRLDLLPIREIARLISVVLTDRVDVGLLTVYDLIALGRHPHTGFMGRLTAADHAAIQQAIELTRAQDLALRAVAELSDGERQRVMVARALAQEPRVMVLDEPTAFLDLPRRVALMGLLRDLAHETKRGILVATHELDIALSVADQIWLFLAGGELRTGLPEELVLDGSFQAAFESSGLTFDPQKGTFVLQRSHRRPIGLSGAGLVADWTAHALERSGFEIVAAQQFRAVGVTVLEDVAGARWRVDAGDNSVTFETLPKLLEYLQHLTERGEA